MVEQLPTTSTWHFARLPSTSCLYCWLLRITVGLSQLLLPSNGPDHWLNGPGAVAFMLRRSMAQIPWQPTMPPHASLSIFAPVRVPLSCIFVWVYLMHTPVAPTSKP